LARPTKINKKIVFFFAFFAATLQAQHLGVYHWAGAVASLSHAEADLSRFPVDTIRIFLGGKYDYEHPENSPDRFAGVPTPLTLSAIVALPRYRALFDDRKIQTVWLTTYPVFNYGRGPVEIDLTRNVPEAEWRQESAQMAELVEWLYREYGSQAKVVLISNNETDEKLRQVGDAPRIAKDLAVRMTAVAQARAKFPDAKLKVFFGAEIKLWHLALPDGRRALEAILPLIHYDFVSFSAWEMVSNPALLSRALEDINLRTSANLTAEGRRSFANHHVLIGEFGHAREWTLPIEATLKPFLDALASQKTPYAVYWQMYDNAAGETRRFGLLDENDHLTLEGAAIGKMYPPVRLRSAQGKP